MVSPDVAEPLVDFRGVQPPELFVGDSEHWREHPLINRVLLRSGVNIRGREGMYNTLTVPAPEPRGQRMDQPASSGDKRSHSSRDWPKDLPEKSDSRPAGFRGTVVPANPTKEPTGARG